MIFETRQTGAKTNIVFYQHKKGKKEMRMDYHLVSVYRKNDVEHPILQRDFNDYEKAREFAQKQANKDKSDIKEVWLMHDAKGYEGMDVYDSVKRIRRQEQ